MKCTIALVVYFLLFCAGNTHARQLQDSIVYRFPSPDRLGSQTLVLRKDSTFFYSFRACISYVCADGRWCYRKDTLILESSFRPDDVPVQVTESEDGPATDSIALFAKDINGEEVFVMYALNGDTVNLTDGSILFDKMPPGSIDSFRVSFENHAHSKWCRVNNPQSNKIVTTVLRSEGIDHYIFFSRRKYLRRNGGLLSLNEEPYYFVHGDPQIIPVILKREKPQKKTGN